MRLPFALRYFSVLLLVFFIWGCGNKQPQKKPEPPLKIAVLFSDMERDGNKVIKKVMQGREKKDNVEIKWYDAKNDPEQQAKQLEKLSKQGVKAAIIQFVDPAAGAENIRGLVEKKVRVVALETLPENTPVDAYITSDHTLAGQLLVRFAQTSARKAAGLPVEPEPGGGQGQGQGQGDKQNQGQTGTSMPPESQVGGKIPIGAVILSGDPGDTMFRQIAAAARTALQGTPEVRLVAEEAVPENDPLRVPVIMQDILSKQGNNVQAVLATDSRLAMAAVEVLRSAGINNRVLTAGVGAGEKATKALESGEHDAEVDTRPDLLGQYALDAAISLAKGGRWEYDGQTTNGSYSVPTRTTPVRLIDSENVYLLKEQWKGIKGSSGGGGSKEQKSSGKQSGGGESSGGEGSGGSGGGQGGQKGKGGQGNKTMLRITTQDGKTMEVQIDGEVKKIESMGGGGGQQQGQQGGQGQQQGQ